MQLVYDEGGVITGIPLTVITSPTGTANTTSGTFTVQAGDAWVGKSIGVGLFTSNNFPEVDNVTLTVVPEPSVTLLGAVGVISLLRRRRA